MEMRILRPRKRRVLRGPDENVDQFTNAEQVKDINSKDLVVMVLGALIALIEYFFPCSRDFTVIIVLGGSVISITQAISLYSRFPRPRRVLR